MKVFPRGVPRLYHARLKRPATRAGLGGQTMDLRGKRLIVTGVASGIGRAAAALLRQSGAIVIGLDRTRADDVAVEFH